MPHLSIHANGRDPTDGVRDLLPLLRLREPLGHRETGRATAATAFLGRSFLACQSWFGFRPHCRCVALAVHRARPMTITCPVCASTVIHLQMVTAQTIVCACDAYGPEGAFSAAQVDEIVSVLAEIRERAAA